MKLESIKNSICSNLNHFPSCETIQNKAVEVANKIDKLMTRSQLFFGLTVIFTLFASHVIIPPATAIAFGAFSTCLAQGAAVFLRSKVFNYKDVQSKMDIILGMMNISAWFLDPAFGLGTVCFTTGVQVSSSILNKVFEIKKD